MDAFNSPDGDQVSCIAALDISLHVTFRSVEGLISAPDGRLFNWPYSLLSLPEKKVRFRIFRLEPWQKQNVRAFYPRISKA